MSARSMTQVRTDFRSPAGKLKTALKRQAKRLADFEDYSAEELETVQFGPPVPLKGDQPDHRRRRYAVPREKVVEVADLVYSEYGIGYLGQTIVRRCSVMDPSLSVYFGKRPKAEETIDQACILEMETPYTYGDWVGGGLGTLVGFEALPGPLILPSWLAEKAYIRRDLDRLGFDWRPVEKPVRVKQAFLLRKTIPSYDWTADTASAYRRAFGVQPPVPDAGSLIYLARFQTRSEAHQRRYPSEKVAEIVENEGGTVFDTREASPEAFDRIARQTECIVADQGSAVFGVLQWQPRALVELFVDGWWHSSNAFFAEATGVRHHHVIAVDKIPPEELEGRIREAIRDARAAAAARPSAD